MYIPYSAYQHPLDKKLLEKVKAIPALPLFVKEFSANFSEIVSRIELLGNGVQVTERTFPKIKNTMPRICEVLGIKEPDVFIIGRGEAIAYTSGIKAPFIVISTELLRRVGEDEIAGIIAHECGHIASDHLLYHQVVAAILAGAGAISGIAATLIPVATPAMLQWYQASEYSADRAAAVALGSVAPIQNGLVKITTGITEFAKQISIDDICLQAKNFDALMNANGWNKILAFSKRLFLTHPWTIKRISVLKEWDLIGGLATACKGDDESGMKDYNPVGADTSSMDF